MCNSDFIRAVFSTMQLGIALDTRLWFESCALPYVRVTISLARFLLIMLGFFLLSSKFYKFKVHLMVIIPVWSLCYASRCFYMSVCNVISKRKA